MRSQLKKQTSLDRRAFVTSALGTVSTVGLGALLADQSSAQTDIERSPDAGSDAGRDTAVYRLPAAPEAVVLDPAETAIIVVDMQNDFVSDGGLLALAGIDVGPIQAVVKPIADVLAGARRVGSSVIYLKMEFRPDLSDLGRADSANATRYRLFGVGESVATPDGGEGRLLIRGTWNTEIVEALKPAADDIVVSKNRFSGFYGTELDTILRTLGVRNLMFTGCTTSVCVESTLRDASFRDYRCVLLEDCAAEPIGADERRTNHEATVLVTRSLLGWVARSADFVSALEPTTRPSWCAG